MNILMLLIPLLAQASPAPGTVNLGGSCTITRASGTHTIELWSSFVSRKYVLGYKGDDGGDYEIQIVNNGSGRFAREHGAVVVGFARANAEVRNPPVLCPISPEEARQECEERNRRENPPFVPHPSDRFTVVKNETGDVNYEVLMGESGPDHFAVTKVSVPVEQIREFEEIKIQTPRAALGGVLASCSLGASRN